MSNSANLLEFLQDKDATIALSVEVQFPGDAPGRWKTGKLVATCLVLEPEKTEEMFAEGYTKSEFIDEVLVGVTGIGRSEDNAMNEDEALVLVKRNQFCVNAIMDKYTADVLGGAAETKNSKRRRKR